MLVDVEDTADVHVRDMARQGELALETIDCARVAGNVGGQGLERDVLAGEEEVLGLVDFAHPAGAEKPHDPEPSRHEVAGGEGRRAGRQAEGLAREIFRELREELLCRIVVLEQRHHRLAQLFVAAARFVQRGRPGRGVERHRGREHFLDLLGAGGGVLHHDQRGGACGWPRSRAYSHACARAHSRSTVRSPISSTSAISFEVMPAKKRNSTMRL